MPSDDEELLRAVALRNASAILQARQRAEEELVRAKESLEARTRELEALNTAGAAIASTLELPSVLQAVTDAATQASGADFGAFFYNTTDAQGDAYSLYSLSGAPRAAFEKFGQPRATPLIARTFNGEGPERCDDVLQHPLYGRMGPHHGMPQGHLPVRSYMAVPVRSRGGEVLGGLFFGHREPGVFTDSSERLALGIAAQASIAIDNARLYADASRMAEDRERLAAAERAARAAADRSSRIKDEFLATLSHELRTPLMAILGWSKVLLAKRTDAEQLAKGLEAIARNAGAQAKLIEDLLDMSRIISGKVRLDVQPTDLSTVIAAAVDSVRPSADAKEIRLRTIVDPGAGPVSGDPSRLQQVVWNLVLNAIKFTPKKGSVDVVLERVNSHVEISIADSGIGVSAEFLPQVFDRFMQADSSTVRTQGGLGLGLSIVKHLVELHGGTVRVASDGENRGSTFVVSLPLASVRTVTEKREHPAYQTTLATDHTLVELRGVRVLVVDDEPDARDLIRQVLLQCHAEVTSVGSAAEGLAYLESNAPHVLLSDIGMPIKDGYAFIEEIRRLPAERGGRTPAIALTAFARSEDRTRALLAGYQLHVSKPIEPHELVVAVASVANRRVA